MELVISSQIKNSPLLSNKEGIERENRDGWLGLLEIYILPLNFIYMYKKYLNIVGN